MPNTPVKKDTSIDAEKFQLEKLKAENDHLLQEKRLELENEKQKLDREKFEFEKSKTEKTERFINKNVGTVITAIVSLTAVVVSLGQVWVTRENIRYATEASERQKNKELELAEVQKKRDWGLSAANFVIANRKVLFSGTDEEKRLYARVIPAMFPGDIADPLLQKLELSSSDKSKAIWREARQTIPKPTETSRVERRVLNIIVTDAQRRPIPGVRITVHGLASLESTDGVGRAQIVLSPTARPGQWIDLLLVSTPPEYNDWVIISPFDGRVLLPNFEQGPSDVVSVVMARRSDRTAMEK